jgi:hypothetical protein
MAGNQKRWQMGKLRGLAALPVAAGMIFAGATAASAAPVHSQARTASVIKTQAAPEITCVSGYAVVYDGGGFYLTAEGVNKPVETTKAAGSCWHTATYGDTGEFVNEGGNCLAWNNDLGEVVVQTCDGGSWQEWTPNAVDGGTTYNNTWYAENYPSENPSLLYAQLIFNGSDVDVNQTPVLGQNNIWHS